MYASYMVIGSYYEERRLIQIFGTGLCGLPQTSGWLYPASLAGAADPVPERDEGSPMLDAVSNVLYDPWTFWGVPLVFALAWEGWRLCAAGGGRDSSALERTEQFDR
jgi:hypothetical protein